MRWLVPLVLSCALLACGSKAGAPGAASPMVHRTQIVIVRDDNRTELDDPPATVALAAAKDALERAVGHPILVEVDAALLPPDPRDTLRTAINSSEVLGRQLSQAEARDPVVMSIIRPKLWRVQARYRAGAEHPQASFDDHSQSLVLSMRDASLGTWSASFYEVFDALQDAAYRELGLRFAGTDPTRVPPSDAHFYLHYLMTRADRSTAESPASYVDRLTKLLSFEAATRGQAVHSKVEQYLGEQAQFLVQSEHQGDDYAAVRRAYAHWVDERFFDTAAPTRDVLYRTLFVGQSFARRTAAAGIPEVDHNKLALGFFEHPAPAEEKPFGAFDSALCLYEERGSIVERHRSCQSIYRFLTSDDARAGLLAHALVKSGRHEFFVAALVEADLSRLLPALERESSAAYRVAVSTLLDADAGRLRDGRAVLSREAARLWPQRPDLHPLLLRVVVEDYRQSGRSDEAYAELPREFGPIDALLFAQFLDLGPRAVELAPMLWPALANVGAPFEIIAPRLAAYTASHAERAMPTVAGLVRRACQTKDGEGLRVIRATLEKQAKNGSPDALSLALAAGNCPARSAR